MESLPSSAVMQGTKAQIIETRKTVPGLRVLDKWAVTIGGGANHRMGLYDMVMIKDNHVTAAGGITAAVQECQVRELVQISDLLEIGCTCDQQSVLQADLVK